MVAGQSQDAGRLYGVAETADGGEDASMGEVQEAPWQTVWRNSCASHQPDASMDRRVPCEADHECDRYCGSKGDGDGNCSTTHHLPSCGLVACEGVVVTQRDIHPAVASVCDEWSPAASDDAGPPADVFSRVSHHLGKRDFSVAQH